jgi:hypothetical protein
LPLDSGAFLFQGIAVFFMNSSTWLGFCILLLSITSSAQGGIFDGLIHDVPPTLDSEILLALPFRSDLGFEPKQMAIEATYRPRNPNEKGVKLQKANEPQGGGDGTYKISFGTTRREAVTRYLVIKDDWIVTAQANSLKIRLPERLGGPGDYRLTQLALTCPVLLCRGKQLLREWTILFSDGARTDKLPPVLLLGVDRASSVTASFQGKVLHIERTEGAYPQTTPSFSRTVQDATGQWHISINAFNTYQKPNDLTGSCAAPAYPRRVNPKQYHLLAWTQPFSEVNVAQMRSDFITLPEGENKFPNWTGCVTLHAQGIGAEESYETRQYYFVLGQLAARRLNRYAFDVSYDESLELDEGQLLFFEATNYRHKKSKGTRTSWSRNSAAPDHKPMKTVPKVDLQLLQREAVEALLIAQQVLSE